MKQLKSQRSTGLWLVLGMLALPALTLASGAEMSESMKKLLGSWHLVSLEHAGSGGTLQRVEGKGKLVFTSEGTMAVQVMYTDTTASGTYATGGYEASYGRFAVKEPSHLFTFHVDGALVRSLIGKDLDRIFEISGNRLVIGPADPREHFKVVWERD